MERSSKYPIDFTSLEKGDVISADEIEEIYGVTVDDPRFSLKVLHLREEIEKHRGDLITRSTQGSIRVLQDIEASDFCESETRRHVRGLERTTRRISRVDPTNMTDQQRRLLEHRQHFAASTAIAAKKAEKDSQHALLDARTKLIEEDAG